MEYIVRFKKLFGLSGKREDSAFGKWADIPQDYWIGISLNKYGLLLLSLWERWEPYIVELGWFGERLVIADGDSEELAPLLWIAEQIGLPDHPDFAEIRKSPRYADIAAKGITLE